MHTHRRILKLRNLIRETLLGFSVAMMAAACGGGGSGTSGSAPTVQISFASAYVAPADSTSLSWTSAGAASCMASGNWTGSKAISGSQIVTAVSAGSFPYTLTCIGPGGTSVATASLAAGLVLPSSYANKNNASVVPPAIPTGTPNAFGIADFFHDGSVSLVAHSLVYNVNEPTTYGNHGQITFYHQGASGNWIDQTSILLSNTVGCLHPRKVVIADFNQDGRPDVFFACHGIDVTPFSGEQPHLLLSQANGTYSNVTLPIICYCHGASAADISGDGYPDILVTDNTVAKTPFFLINNRDGTFTRDLTRLPASLANKQIFSAELVDLAGTGTYDVFLGGNEPGTSGAALTEFSPTILPNDGSGKFISTTAVNLLVGPSFGLALDIVYQGGAIYLLKVNNAYTSSQIQKLTYPSLQASVIYSHSGTYAAGPSWLDWIIPRNGQIVSEDAAFGVSIPQ